jgi:hypothetical protein
MAAKAECRLNNAENYEFTDMNGLGTLPLPRNESRLSILWAICRIHTQPNHLAISPNLLFNCPEPEKR